MITLNIISDQQRSIIQKGRTYAVVKRICISTLGASFLICVMLLATYLALDKKLDSLIEENQRIEQEINSDEEQSDIMESANQLNQDLARLDAAQNEYFEASKIITPLADYLAEGVFINSFTFNIRNRSFEISGFSPTRDAFIKTKQQIDDSEMFSNIQSPVSNLLKKEEINFTISGELVLNDIE